MKNPIPDVALDGRLAIVGLSGSGKSTTAKGGVERILRLKHRVCVVDLLDGWWGLRVKRDGKTPAFPAAIFGGRHGDLPLTEHAGALVGQAVAQSEGSTIVSLAEIDTDAARRRFALAFFDALHRHNRAPLHLVIDEADFYAPQNPIKDGPGPLLLNRVKEIAARGRMRGFRVWLITQRPAKLHKDALSQADTLIAMQLTSSHDRLAIEGWIGDQADRKTGAEILATLPRLKRGQGVLWSPRLGILEPTHFPLPETYDSSRTPEYGETLPDVALAPLDLGALRDKMATVEAETKANDPRALRTEIANLRKQLGTPATPNPDHAREKVREYTRGKVAGYAEACKDMAATAGRAMQELEVISARIDIALPEMRKIVENAKRQATDPPLPDLPKAAPIMQKPYSPPVAPKPRAEGVNGPQQKILDALAWWAAISATPPTRIQVAVVAGYSPQGGAFQNPLGSLRSMGMVEYPAGGTIALTAEGRAAANVPETGPTTEALHAKIMAILDGPKRRILQPLLDAYPSAMSREMLAQASSYQPTGGAFQNPLGALRSLGLIDYPASGHVAALPILFVE